VVNNHVALLAGVGYAFDTSYSVDTLIAELKAPVPTKFPADIDGTTDGVPLNMKLPPTVKLTPSTYDVVMVDGLPLLELSAAGQARTASP